MNLLSNPSDEFIRLLIRDHVYSGKMTAKVIEDFRGIVRKSILDALHEIVKKGLQKYEDYILDPSVGINNTSEVPIKEKKKLPTMSKLFEWGLIKTGDIVYLKNRQQEKAEVIDYKSVIYKGNRLTFNQWAQQVTGWGSICVYDHIIVKGQTETLSVSRRKKMLELEKAKQKVN